MAEITFTGSKKLGTVSGEFWNSFPYLRLRFYPSEKKEAFDKGTATPYHHEDFLNKKVIVCRKVTERTESLGKSSFLCSEPKKLQSIFNEVNNDYILNYTSPYGDGKSSERIIEILKNYI